VGARISTGANSKQDYTTPDDFMEAVVHRFGPIAFDLAARADNARSPNYFAPVTGPEGPLPFDPKAHGMDTFDHSWAKVSCDDRFRRNELGMHGSKGLSWLNCEFDDIPKWSSRCRNEAILGANILLLTPAAVGSNWFIDNIAGPRAQADVYLLKGRISFIPGKPYNKDCMLSHYYSNPGDREGILRNNDCRPIRWMHVWDWKNDLILQSWACSLDERRKIVLQSEVL
jgi:hypothetical protein